MANKKHKVSASILSADFSRLGDEVRAVEAAGADWIHVDVMDGHFVPNLTMGIPIMHSLKKISVLPLDVHLMVEQPEKMIDAFALAGADTLTIHIESTKNIEDVLKQIHKMNVRTGITLKPSTSVQSLFPFLEWVDLVLIMTVEPGFSGQSFLKESASKISPLRLELLKRKLDVLIEIDGGVNEQTLSHLKEADILVSGNFIFRHPNYRRAIQILQEG